MDLLEKCANDNIIYKVELNRSPEIASLDDPPYKLALLRHSSMNLEDSHCNGDDKRQNLLIYCLPSSVTEYLSVVDEANKIRSVILSSRSNNNETVVVMFNPNDSTFVGCSASDIIFCLSSGIHSDEIANKIASSSLSALASLDSLVAKEISDSCNNTETLSTSEIETENITTGDHDDSPQNAQKTGKIENLKVGGSNGDSNLSSVTDLLDCQFKNVDKQEMFQFLDSFFQEQDNITSYHDLFQSYEQNKASCSNEKYVRFLEEISQSPVVLQIFHSTRSSSSCDESIYYSDI